MVAEKKTEEKTEEKTEKKTEKKNSDILRHQIGDYMVECTTEEWQALLEKFKEKLNQYEEYNSDGDYGRVSLITFFMDRSPNLERVSSKASDKKARQQPLNVAVIDGDSGLLKFLKGLNDSISRSLQKQKVNDLLHQTLIEMQREKRIAFTKTNSQPSFYPGDQVGKDIPMATRVPDPDPDMMKRDEGNDHLQMSVP